MKQIILIPGLGADERLFQFIDFSNCEKQVIKWMPPKKDENFSSYILKLKGQIVSKQPPVLIGVSLGGMVAMELRELIPVEKTIIISSIKTKDEMPAHFNLIKRIKLNEVISPAFLKKCTPVIKPFLVDTSNKKTNEIINAMIQDSNNDFITSAIKFVLHWSRAKYDSENLIHIHGTKDIIFPLRNIRECNYKIEDGAHDMILSKHVEINKILLQEIFK